MLRTEARPADRAAVRAIVESTGFFSAAEVEIAVELIDDRLAKGEKSDYRFVFADDAASGRTLGYACFGEIACTVGSYDLYWIAVHEDARGRGLGRVLSDECERRIRALKGRRVYAETSGRAQYEPTRAFYRALGYLEEARFADFYAPGDDKVVYGKEIGSGESGAGSRGERESG
jgi:ribosomal protein S18 acetylase RimI-like enzyme